MNDQEAIAANGGSGSTHCSFSAISFTREEVIAKIKEWTEAHNPEVDWDWSDMDEIEDQMKETGYYAVDTLLDMFK